MKKTRKVKAQKSKPIYCPLFTPAQHIGFLNDVLIAADSNGRAWRIDAEGRARPVVFTDK